MSLTLIHQPKNIHILRCLVASRDILHQPAARSPDIVLLALNREAAPGIELAIGEHHIAGGHVPAPVLVTNTCVGLVGEYFVCIEGEIVPVILEMVLVCVEAADERVAVVCGVGTE